MSEKKEFSNIRPYKKKWQFNIGLIIFGTIFIYLLASVLLYVTASHVSAYEVREGTILKDNAYTGIAIRNEEVIAADRDGYINYYVSEGSKVAVGANIYSIVNDKMDMGNASITEGASPVLSKEMQNKILLKMQKFNSNFDGQNFEDTYSFKSDIEDTILNASSQTRIDQLNAKIASEGIEGLQLYQTPKDGIVVYSLDQKEGLTVEEVTNKDFDRSNYKKVECHNNEKISAGNPVYKIIDSENWSLVIPLSNKTAKELTDTQNIKVRFLKDNETIWSSFSMFQNGKEWFGRLDFDNSMIRYASERYLDIELISKDETGLKIPKSAQTQKAFYVVPAEYVTQGGGTKETGVLRKVKSKKGKELTEFVPAEVYFAKDDNVYLDTTIFKKDDLLVKPKSTDTFLLHERKNLKGVYSINKGYAVFKQIRILCESDEYFIVEEGNNYGLSNYDHIALNGKKIQENEVVFR